MISSSVAIPIERAERRCRWSDFVNDTPEHASTVMSVVLGLKVTATQAQRAIRSERQRQMVPQAVADFKKCMFDQRPTCTLHRVMTGKRV